MCRSSAWLSLGPLLIEELSSKFWTYWKSSKFVLFTFTIKMVHTVFEFGEHTEKSSKIIVQRALGKEKVLDFIGNTI